MKRDIRGRSVGRWAVRVSGGALLVVATAVGCAKATDAGSSTPATSAGSTPSFARPADSSAAIRAAKLPEMSEESFVVHHHGHLELNINGKKIDVPANIGVTEKSISPLHTHDGSGILHIEAANPDTITIGQFFTEWAVKLDKNCVATYCTDDKNQLLAFVDGQPVADPAAVPITEHASVYIWYGPMGTTPTAPIFDFQKAGS